ncbi:MAG: DMT family transporter [Verrucomicrobia bacterium]|nr:DMT family transporter [Verrucomicrobiota bacterium]
MRPTHLLLLLGMNLLWSASYSINKALAPHLGATDLVTLRYALATVCLLPLWPWLPGSAPRGRDLATALIMGVLVFSAAQQLQVAGVQLGRAGDTSLLIALDPLVTSLGAAVFLGERLAARRWLGFGLGMLGAVCLARPWSGAFHWPGLVANGLILLSLGCEAAYSSMGKPLLERVAAMKLLVVALLGGTAVNLLLAAPRGLAAVQVMPVSAWWLMAYLVIVCTLVGYPLWLVVIREAEVNAVALTIFVQPAAGLLIAHLWLKEPLHAGHFWGSLAIVAGLLVGLRDVRVSPART